MKTANTGAFSTLEWIQAKYGIAIAFAGSLATAMNPANAECYLRCPVAGGLAIALLALLSKKLKTYHYTPLQFNNGLFLLMFFWAGISVATDELKLSVSHQTPIGMAYCVFAVCVLSFFAIFSTSCTYQDEMEELEKPDGKQGW